MTDLKDRLLDAALLHVPFDGWSPQTFDAAIRDAEVDPAAARAACPRGAIDLAIRFHQRGDEAMEAALREMPLGEMKIREKVTAAVRARIEAIEDREAVRRGSTLFAMPHLAADGARLIWGTADRIWTAIGDSSDDVNWYTKRATLAGVHGSTVLYWLGDDSAGSADTWAFLDRRIGDVMAIEKAKAAVNKNPLLRAMFAGPIWASSFVKAPRGAPTDLPGSFSPRTRRSPAPPMDEGPMDAPSA